MAETPLEPPARVTAAISRELHGGEDVIWQQPRAGVFDFTKGAVFLRGLVPLVMGCVLVAMTVLIPLYPGE